MAQHSAAPVRRFSVGLTGGIGSGKSLIADMFAAKGAAIIDTDVIAHLLTAPGGKAIPAIETQFGAAFIAPDGAMDRSRMRAHVFGNADERKKLEAILHPLIRKEAHEAALQSAGAYPMFVVPLLIESSDWKARVTRVLVVDCPESLQVDRVMQRNRFPENQVRAIMANQASRQERLSAADDVILNDSGMATLIPQVDRLHALYSGLVKAQS